MKTFRLAIARRIADNIFFAESPPPRRMGFPSTRFRLNPSRTEPAFIRTLLPSILRCTCFYTHLSRKSPFQSDARTADCPFDDRSECSAFREITIYSSKCCNDRSVITINWPEHVHTYAFDSLRRDMKARHGRTETKEEKQAVSPCTKHTVGARDSNCIRTKRMAR